MSEFGIKIKNYEAGSIYGYMLGIRQNYDTKDALLTNSLFNDFLNTLEEFTLYKGVSTRDIISIGFKYGTHSYKQEVSHIKTAIKKIEKEEKNELKKKEKINNYNRALQIAEQNQDKFEEKKKESIRELFYTEGVDIHYPAYNKKGELLKDEIIHYKMLYRTPGKAKKGSCMFINEKLYDAAHNFLFMGIKLPYHNSPIIEMGAYSSLITSAIVGRVRINPKNILVLNDVESLFETNVVSIENEEYDYIDKNGDIEKRKKCIAKSIDKYKLKNTLFDGQALIDSSIFPEWADGYILLRHHLCKMAAFCSNIQLFFKDYYGDNYYSATVKDMWGNEHYVKDIELITTDNAMKWLKFDISYEYWCDRVYENNCMFGIVKTAHKSKLGDVQKMSYQMNNALEIDIMDNVLQVSVNYIESMKKDDSVFLDYLRDNVNFANDYDVLIALCEQNPEFTRSKYFRDRKNKIIETYVLNFKTGKSIQHGDNLVIVGSPYAMLLHTVGEDVEKDDTFTTEDNCIQCFTERFKDGEYLAEFRSPFNSKNNMGYLHNTYNEKFDRYFKFGKQIIAINMIHTDFQDRNNGSDQDSDSLYVTNQKDIVSCAKNCYNHYPTIVNNIPMEKNSYDCTLLNYAKIDNNLAAAQLAIGTSSNLAQICLTYTYNTTGEEYEKYTNYVCILSVLAQVAIDNAKRKFDIDLNTEISRIQEDMDIDNPNHGYPVFWKGVKDKKSKKGQPKFKHERINHNLRCPMNSICDVQIQEFKPEKSTLPMESFFVKYELDEHRRKSKKVEELIQKYSLNLFNLNIEEDEEKEEYLLLRDDFDKLIEDIQSIYISKNYLGLMSWLIDRAFNISAGVKRRRTDGRIDSTINTNKSLLLKVLYNINQDSLLKCFNKSIYSGQ